MAARGVRVSIVRLAPSVHGDGDHGFVPHLIRHAREKGVSGIRRKRRESLAGGALPGRRPLVPSRLERNAANARYHGAAEEGVPFLDIAGVIGRRLNLPVVSLSREEAADHFGWFAHFAALDNATSSQRTREQLQGEPRQPGLIADLGRPAYFEA